MELGEAWRGYKHELYKGWVDRVGTSLASIPIYDECPLSQYREMISYWSSDKFKVFLVFNCFRLMYIMIHNTSYFSISICHLQEASIKNKKNKCATKYVHTLGKSTMAEHERKQVFCLK